MSDLLVFQDLRPRVGPIVLDHSVSEAHELDAVVSTEPVGTDDERTGAVQIGRRRLRIVGRISPHVAPENGRTPEDPSGTRHIRAWGQFVALLRRKEPITVITSLDSYEGVVATRISAPRNVVNSGILEISVDLEELPVADTDSIPTTSETYQDIGGDEVDLGVSGGGG